MATIDRFAYDGRNVLTGVGLMSLAMLTIPTMDIIAKYLSATIPPLEISFARFFFQTLIALVLILIGPGLITLRDTQLVLQCLRGIFIAIATLLFFSAIKFMPVANATAIFFIEPMILTALSAIFLREKVGIRRWSAIIFGLVGAMFVLRPSVFSFGWYAVLPLGTALFFALYLLITRRLTASGSALAMQFFTGVSGSVFLGILLFITSLTGIKGHIAIVPTNIEFLLLAAIGGISFTCHGLIVMAFAKAPAVVLAPLSYLEIVSATILGVIVFGDFPDLFTWIGIIIIVMCGIYIAHRTRAKS